MKFVEPRYYLFLTAAVTLLGNNSLFFVQAAKPCAISDSVEGLGSEYEFSDIGKLSIIGFTTTRRCANLSTW